MSSPLHGIRVLDFSRVLSGPYASMHLADMGADVVKVEHPTHGDDTRGFGPPFTEGVSTYFLSVNRGKRSIGLNLKDPVDRDKAQRLAMEADVLIENFRPGVMSRLGLGSSELRTAHPGLIYCSISGFGQAQPRAGYDLMVQGLSGIPTLTGSADGPPNKCGASIADMVAGLNATQAILAALYRRTISGEGAVIDVPMIDGQLSLLTYHAGAHLNGGRDPGRIGNAHPSIHPFCQYRSSDGYFNLCIGNDILWRTFCRVMEMEDLGQDARFEHNPSRVENRNELDAILAPIFAESPSAHWLNLLESASIPCGAIRTVTQALSSAEVVTHEHPSGGPPVRSIPLPFTIEGASRASTRRAPQLGEHTAEILSEWLNPDAER
jgi:crotonobetainyl-CoA:carnitine CoA-transferase CaiB-like acyl-CoA transferase